MRKLVALSLLLYSDICLSIPLDSWPTWSTSQPYISKSVPPGAMIVRGSGTDQYYVLEADPTTGELPVALSGGSIAIDFSGPTGDPVPADAGFMGGVDGSGNLRGLKVDTNGELQVDVLSNVLPTGAATEAKQDDMITELTSIDGKTPSLGQAAMAASVPVAIANNQSAIPVSQSGTWTVDISGSATISVENFPTTVSTNVGASDASTLRVSEGSRTYADSVRQDYSSGNVTTAAWTQLIASTAAAMNHICITDQSGQIMELGTGSAAAETRVFLIARGFSGCIPLRIASGTRISIKAVSATANSGDFVLSGMN